MTDVLSPHHDAIVLDNAAWHALSGPHARFAEGNGLVRRYRSDVAPFVAVRTWDDPGIWDALIGLVGHGAEIGVSGALPDFPDGWVEVGRGEGVQLVETAALRPVPDPEAVLLGEDDVAEMLALVGRNQPGPFLPRTHELGRYIGFRREGRLVAMAGERLQPDGWTEISAVSTDDAYRRQGLASRLVLDAAFHIRQRGDRALMHAAATNVGAIAAYERLGFALRSRTTFAVVRVP
ncbi:GNAT family N-acetyltransferase [Microbacterium sp. zg.B48]|uniref:GNAT family N-acetyltransferase n=1 Tax=unclassified Microbacterium TaxID=2609290 RepID=UPI00214CC56F|nr:MULTISPECIES: GNAT family N-acetyltransferase [unclassified Microbacterium]MCR2761908.1 GNAT family N-acetyltransferase [Microbacterium sp. zg.B48]MCR2811175.1 GNAT family N-acetyltransferase [Microbacterium sp. zg.B185]WIM20712.1 GNAT family N-acetyltransferase [Microbacterium sp. zg-B185]